LLRTLGLPEHKVKTIIDNRKECNAVLDRVQSRLNRGHRKGANALIHNWIAKNNPMRWEVSSFTSKINTKGLLN
jgi:hypothetical protein